MKKEELNEIEMRKKTSASSCWMMGIFFLGLKRKAHHPREATLGCTNELLPDKNKNEIATPVGACIARPQNAITLISLVITIIILLILAGVTINLTLQENGILGLAQNSSKNYINAQEKELTDLENLYGQIMVATNDEAKITISMKDLKKLIIDEIALKMQSSANNSLVYSTTEQVVGTWIDGKPLYKKTFDYGSALNVSNTIWTDTKVSISENNIDHIIKAEGVSQGTSSDDCCFALYAHTEDSVSTVHVLVGRESYGAGCRYFTFYYTKTTDTPIVQ